jgi:hypothetical protein
MSDNVIIRMRDQTMGGYKASPERSAGPAIAIGNAVDTVTAPVVQSLIREFHPDATVERVEIVDEKGLGQMVSTAGRAELRLTYGPGSPPLPERVILKMVIGEPGVPGVLYETEVQMYRKFLPELDIEKLNCIGAAYDGETERFLLLLEDLTPRQPYFPKSTDPGMSPDRVAGLLGILARLHAHYWNSPRLEQERGWLSGLLDGDQFDFFEAITASTIEELTAASSYRQDLLTRVGRTPAQLWEGVKAAHRHHYRIFPQTLLHGDTGAHNTYHLADGAFGFLDWQLSARGPWVHDVHYLICTALSVADRRGHDRALVAHYLSELRALGVPDVPDIETAMAAFARAIMWGFTVGWLLCPERNYGMEIISTNLERLFAAMCDHDTLALTDKVMA